MVIAENVILNVFDSVNNTICSVLRAFLDHVEPFASSKTTRPNTFRA